MMLPTDRNLNPTEKLFYSILALLVEDDVMSEKNAETKKAPKTQSEIMSVLMNEGIGAPPLAKAIGKRLSKPVFEVGAPAQLRGEGWVLANDIIYVMNPFGDTIERLIPRGKKDHPRALVFTGFGILPYDAFEHPSLADIPFDLERRKMPRAETDQKTSEVEYTSNREAGEHLCDYLMTKAIRSRSSDIHLSPRSLGGGHYRFRIDGQLVTVGTIENTEHYEALINVFLSKAQLNPGEFTEPKDGSFKWRLENRELGIRLSLIPVTAEASHVLPKLTLRLLGLEMSLLKLSSLGLTTKQYETYRKISRRSQGLALVTGPTGSGKSTTLFANMREAYDFNPNRSYYTVEDPVEIKIPNFYQIEINVKAGVTFPGALRALLRADPDVILVGEIRDFETAKLAIQASLTGHLVFSTLHTNGAVETISRMFDLGIDGRLLADALIAVSAQRMVRSVCQTCAKKITFQESAYYNTYRKITIFEGEKEVPALRPDDDILIAPQNTECKSCNGQGYKGRHQASEMFTRDAALQRMITNQQSITDILEHLKKHQHYENMWQHGLRLVKQGITTFSELEAHLEPLE